MDDRAFIRVYDDAIPEDLCQALVERLHECRQVNITKPGGVSGGFNPSMKKSDEISIYRGDPLRLAVDEFLEDIRIRYFKDVAPHYPSDMTFNTRPAHLVRYPKGVGHMEPHVDHKPESVSREVTFVGYLNTVEEGGETVFPRQNMAVKPKRGRIVVFPPFWMFPHYSKVTVSDDKWVVATIHAIEGTK